MMDRTGKYGVGHREGCAKDAPPGWYALICSCDWLDHIDHARAESGFHWSDGVYFKRLDDGTVRMRIFGHYNGTPNYTDRIIPAAEWASIVCAVSALGETGERWNAAQDFHGRSL